MRYYGIFFFLCSLGFIGSVLIRNPINDQTLGRLEDLDTTVSENMFRNLDNSSVYVSLTENKWIESSLYEPKVVGSFFYFSPVDIIVTGQYCYIVTETSDEFISLVIDEDEDYAYVTRTASGLFIIDIKNKRTPALVGEFAQNNAWKSDVKGDVLFLSNSNGNEYFIVLNVTDPSNPTVLGDVLIPDEVNDLFVYEDFVIVGCKGSINIIDVSDLNEPYIRLTASKSDVEALSVSTDGEFLYVGIEGPESGLLITNLTDPTLDVDDIDRVFSFYETSGYPYDLVVSHTDKMAFIANYDASTTELVIVNMENVTDSKYVYSNSTQFGPEESMGTKLFIATEKELAFFCDRHYGFRIFNYSSNEYLFRSDAKVNSFQNSQIGIGMGTYPPTLQAYHVYFDREEPRYVYITTSDSLQIFDLSNENIPTLIAEYETGESNPDLQKIAVRNKYAYVVDSRPLYGIRILDLQDRSHPKQVSLFHAFPGERVLSGMYVDESGTTIYVCDLTTGGFSILDSTNKSDVKLVFDFMQKFDGLPFYINDLYVLESHNLLFTAELDYGMKIFDCSNTSDPVLLSTTIPSFSTSIMMPFSLRVVEKEYYNPETEETELRLIAFLADYSDGLKILDVTDPENPTFMSSFDTHMAISLSVSETGNFVYLSDYSGGTKAIDVSDLLNPELVGTLDKISYEVVSKDNYVYTANSFYGLQVSKFEVGIRGTKYEWPHFCGETTVQIVAEDLSGEVHQNVVISREDYCYGRGTCLKGYACECEVGYTGTQCDGWECMELDFRLMNQVCNGHGYCEGPETCECDSGYAGKYCSTNLYYFTVMTPILTVAFMLFTCILIFICCLASSFCCTCCSLIILSLCGLSVLVVRQFYGLRRFGRLKNFEILLKEQILEEDSSVAHFRFRKELFEVNMKDIKTISVLGEGGSNSVVFKALWNGNVIAFKCFKTRNLMSTQDAFDEFEREVEILSSVAHPSIVRFFGATFQPPRVGILMEFCSNGEILDFVVKFRENYGSEYPIPQKCRLLSETVSALSYLHDRNVIHRDLKCENVLISENEQAKLMDFGLSRCVENMDVQKTTRVGTNIYMAPEIVLSSFYDEKSDVYSFGIMMYVLLTENPRPYESLLGNEFQVELKVANDSSFRPPLDKLVLHDDEMEKWMKNLIRKSWDHDPSNRHSMKEIREILVSKGSAEKGYGIVQNKKDVEKNIVEEKNDDE